MKFKAPWIARIGAASLGVSALLMSLPAQALEYPIGEPQEGGGLEVAAVYLQPITMEPEGIMRPADQSDVHLEADIHALADNKNGLAEGEWAPYLEIGYTLTKLDDGKSESGMLMPMVANDGPHYGDNVKLMGPGKYRLTLDVAPPTAASKFGRHIDKETGVAPWFKPFKKNYDFVFAGIGKKGGY
ncbi:iron transporter [Thalassospira sp.]|uniref:iron transporter n=1 Tax=Thalassospira sp. TaxID=1912094 RepID=UPI003AA8F5A6